jgi:RNA polymerase sigma-54 factor
MKLGQHMKLAPRMIQSMEILQMPLNELEERIEQELENNATLERAEGDGTTDAADAAAEADLNGEASRAAGDDAGRDVETARLDLDGKSGAEDFQRLESYEESNPDAAENEFEESRGSISRNENLERGLEHGEYSSARMSGERDAKMDAMASTPARSGSLHDQLRAQWALTEVEESLRPLGALIISFLDDDGYLRTPLETIIDRAPVGSPSQNGEAPDPGIPILSDKPTTEQMERALKAVQLFLEPAGVAARDPRECLLLQLDALAEEAADLGWPPQTVAAARVLLDQHLDDLMQNRLPRVAEKTGFSRDEIKEALTLIKRLSVAPAKRLVSDDARPIIPDAIVEYDADADRYIAYLNERVLPNLKINQEYAKIAKDKQVAKKDREFLKTNLGNAQWLIDAVNQRKHTLLRVVRAVVDAQRDFFDYGPQALKPLPMTLVAEQLGIHVATVSRAVAEKYLATPRGIVPLRKFFSGGLQTTRNEDGEGGGEEMAWDAIKVALKEVIDGEDKGKPLSDEALVIELKKRGIDIARRTIAKYRDQLQIPAARLRKIF